MRTGDEHTQEMVRRESVFARAVRVMQTEGLGGVSRRVADAWRRNFGYASHYLLVLPISPNTPLLHIKTDVTVEQVEPENSAAVRELVGMYGVPATEDGICSRLRQPEELCFVGRIDGKIVSYVWIHHAGEVKEFGERLLRLAPDEAYYHDVYTVPDWRGIRIYPAMKSLFNQRLAQQYGKRNVVGYVGRGNIASLHASSKLGEVHVGWLEYVKVFKRSSGTCGKFGRRKYNIRFITGGGEVFPTTGTPF